MPLMRGTRRGQPSSHPSTSTTRAEAQTPFTRPLPPYEPPSHPLNLSSTRALSTLAQKHTFASAPSSSATRNLQKHLKEANEKLVEVTDNIHVMAKMRREDGRRDAMRRRQRGRTAATEGTNNSGEMEVEGEEGNGDGEEETKKVKEVEERVEGLTREIEERVRGLIDVRARVGAREKVMREMVGEVEGGNGIGTQDTLGVSQSRNGREDGEGVGAGAGVGLAEKLNGKVGEWEKEYQGLSMRERYATHNDYKAFRSTMHYAQHDSENPPPVPHAKTWFSSGSDGKEDSQPSLTRYDSKMVEDIDSESDIETVGASISTDCPITLQPMKDPVTSKVCPHSFEKKAIETMIRQANGRILGCPVCGKELTINDLVPDPVLRRNIQRIQADKARKRDAEDDDNDDEYTANGIRSQSKRAQSVDSNYESRGSVVPQFKSERVRSSMMRSSVVPSTQPGKSSNDNDVHPSSMAEVVDLGGGGSDDDESDEEE